MFKLKINNRILNQYDSFLMTALRLSIGIVFIWFGILKLLGFNPVYDLIFNSIMPDLAYGAGLFILGAAEAFIGVMIVVNRWLVFTHFILFFHLLGTFSTFIFGWGVIFDPYFPVLSLDGEFVVKNVVLSISGLVVLIHELKRSIKM